MKIPTVRVVFDRKKVATKKNKGLIQIEVLYDRRRKFFSTGIKVYKDQWNDRKWVVNASNSYDLNDGIRKQVEDLEKWLMNEFSVKEPFAWSRLDAYLNRAKASESFIAYLKDKISGRNDIRETTRKAHGKLIGMLGEYAKIKYFFDLTPANILAFDNFLHGRRIRKLDRDGAEHYVPMRQQSIYGYHKLMRTYIHLAMREERIVKDPYSNLKFQRGEGEAGRYLSPQELKKLSEAEMRSGSVARARDMFIFQSYTGLSYSDLALFDFSRSNAYGNDFVYSGQRKKTGEEFFFVILEPAICILQKYQFKLPVISGQSYNENLKKAAEDAGIDKPLSSHWARRTAGMMLLNAGVRLETVAKILGHASVKTTEKFYAEMQKKTVIDEMKKAGL